MSWFQLDPESIAARARSAGQVTAPTLGGSLVRGIVGFTLVSLAGFAPWAVFGLWFKRSVGELGMYLACALVFIGSSGLLLHRLIIGPGSLPRFYKLFSLAFTAYSVAWIVAWMTLRGHPGSVVGLLAGTAVMGWMLAVAFDARAELWKIVAALFLLNSAGYFIGGFFETLLLDLKECTIIPVGTPGRRIVAQLQWGLFYGIGLGAGLGLAFYFCQAKARALLSGSRRK